MGLLDKVTDKYESVKDTIQDKFDEHRDSIEREADKKYAKKLSEAMDKRQHEQEQIESDEKAGAISARLAERRRQRAEAKESKQIARAEKKNESESKPLYEKIREAPDKFDKKVYPVYKKAVDTVGGVIVAGTKAVISDGHGRSGQRKTKAYRRANREYNSEARKMRSQVSSVSQFNAFTMFGGGNAPPTRSRYKGTHEAGGAVDPLSNWSSNIMGARKVRQDSTVEGIASKMAGRQSPGRKPKKSGGDHLTNFSRGLMGF
jgi:hypothetical protein